MLTKNSTVDVVEAIAWYQSISTGGTGETLQVVYVALCPHDHLTGRYRLATGTACPTVPKQPNVIAPTQDHAPFAVASGANVAQLCVAAGALEAACVPVALHGEEQETVRYLSPTSGT